MKIFKFLRNTYMTEKETPLCLYTTFSYERETFVKVQNHWVCTLYEGCKMYGFLYVGGMAVAVDPGSPYSSGAVIRKQLIVGCILFY